MSSQRFQANVQWQYTRAALWLAALLVLVGVILLAYRNSVALLWTLVGAGAVLVVAAVYRDRGNRCSYVLESDRLVLRRIGERLEIPLDDVLDASLVDRKAAREYFVSMMLPQVEGAAGRQRAKRDYLRYCTVDVGLRTFDWGRPLRERLSNSRHEVVLLRTRSHGTRLLSPVYDQDLIAAVSRAVLRRTEAGQL